MKIILDNSEMLICSVVATLRNTTARGNGVRDARMDNKMTAIDIDTIGMMAELAWAKWKDCYPDLSVFPQSGTHDFVIDGYTIDIKATRVKSGRLLATLKKSECCSDIYVLGIVDGNEVDFVGYATKSDLFREENIRDLGRGNGYSLDQSSLRKFKEEK